jgi:hypothetical protein
LVLILAHLRKFFKSNFLPRLCQIHENLRNCPLSGPPGAAPFLPDRSSAILRLPVFGFGVFPCREKFCACAFQAYGKRLNTLQLSRIEWIIGVRVKGVSKLSEEKKKAFADVEDRFSRFMFGEPKENRESEEDKSRKDDGNPDEKLLKELDSLIKQAARIRRLLLKKQ